MNPEIRFRVPRHVHQLAHDKARKLGLRTRRGRTGGPSELARCALYTLLGLGLPESSEQLIDEGLNLVKATRDEFETQDTECLRVTVHHRVCPEFRKSSGLEGRAIAARQSTEFVFRPGELPDFLVGYVLLTERGNPFVSINLEGRLSPRKNSVGELQTATEKATLSELRACLQAIAYKKSARQSEKALAEERKEKGTKLLRAWSQTHGSELLQARLAGAFDWLELACLEYARHQLHKLGVEELTYLPTTHSLERSALRYQSTRPQEKPQLSTLKLFQQLQDIQDEGLSVSVVLVEDTETLTTREAVQVSVTLPVPGRLHFLTGLIPAEQT